MKRYCVRPFVRPSVCPSMGPQQQTRCCRTRDNDRLLQKRRANTGSATLSAYVGSWTQMCFIWNRHSNKSAVNSLTRPRHTSNSNAPLCEIVILKNKKQYWDSLQLCSPHPLAKPRSWTGRPAHCASMKQLMWLTRERWPATDLRLTVRFRARKLTVSYAPCRMRNVGLYTAKRCTHPRSYVEYFMILWINLYYTVSHNIYPPQGFLSIFPPTTEYFKIKFYTLIACSHVPNFMQLSLTMTKKLCHIKQDHIENFTFH